MFYQSDSDDEGKLTGAFGRLLVTMLAKLIGSLAQVLN